MTQTQSRYGHIPYRAIGLSMLLAVSSAVGGCYPVDESGQLAGPEEFCGILYPCGNHGGSDNNNEPAPETSTASSSSGSSGSTGGESTTPTGGQ